MKLVVDTKRIHDLRKKGVSGWELMMIFYLEEILDGKDGWEDLPVVKVEADLGLPATAQTRLLRSLTARGMVETKRVGLGAVRRKIRIKKRVSTKS